MIVKLKGFIEDWFEDFVDLDVKGVVYRVFVPKKNINKISEKGSLATFFIFEILKESERLFFGFSNKNDRELFSDLLKVQGVGGKMALNIMSSLDSEVIQQSIIVKNHFPSKTLVPLPMICLNSIILFTGRINAIFRIFFASTPVESF